MRVTCPDCGKVTDSSERHNCWPDHNSDEALKHDEKLRAADRADVQSISRATWARRWRFGIIDN